jgi:hypothetical protein
MQLCVLAWDPMLKVVSELILITLVKECRFASEHLSVWQSDLSQGTGGDGVRYYPSVRQEHLA